MTSPWDYAIAYVPKPFCLLSIVCSYTMIRELWADHRAKRGKAVTRFLISMSIADILFSGALFFGTWVMPRSSGFVHSFGTMTTCNLQGFIIQIGLVAFPLFNGALSSCFLAIIRFNMSDAALQKWEPCVHVVAWLVALAWAIAAWILTLYNPMEEGDYCWVESCPSGCTGDGCTRGRLASDLRLVIGVLIWALLLESSVVMLVVYLTVFRRENTSKKYATSLKPRQTISFMNRTEGATSRKLQGQEEGTSVADPSGHSAEFSSSAFWHSTTSASPPVAQQYGQHVVNHDKSRAVAVQAICYAGAFIATFSPPTISTSVKFFAGVQSPYFELIANGVFVCLGGLFHFLTFARNRNKMRTPEGRLLRKLVCACCCCFHHHFDEAARRAHSSWTNRTSTKAIGALTTTCQTEAAAAMPSGGVAAVEPIRQEEEEVRLKSNSSNHNGEIQATGDDSLKQWAWESKNGVTRNPQQVDIEEGKVEEEEICFFE